MNDENDNNLHTPSVEPHGGMQDDNEDSVALESGRPAVASAPGKILVFLIAGAIFVAIVVKAIFFPGAGPPENKIPKRPERVAAAPNLKSSNITPGELPQPPQPDADMAVITAKLPPPITVPALIITCRILVNCLLLRDRRVPRLPFRERPWVLP